MGASDRGHDPSLQLEIDPAADKLDAPKRVEVGGDEVRPVRVERALARERARTAEVKRIAKKWRKKWKSVNRRRREYDRVTSSIAWKVCSRLSRTQHRAQTDLRHLLHSFRRGRTKATELRHQLLEIVPKIANGFRSRKYHESEEHSPTNQDNSRGRAYTDEWVASLFTPGWPRHQEYLELSDNSLGHLKEVRGLGHVPDAQVPLITIVHNEMPRLPDFFRHYRKLGVKRFIVVDHRSDDGTSKFLKAQPDVHLFRAESGYYRALSGQMWVTGLARRFSLGRWALHVDVDEHLVYEGMESFGIAELAALLDRRGQTRLYAPTIDMYSRGPIREALVKSGARMIDVAPYFDPFSHGDLTFYKRLKPHGLWNYRRGRAFGDLQGDGEPIPMEKFPLSKWNRRTAYCWVHHPFPHEENPSSQLGALLHFRFSGNFIEYNRDVATLGEVWDGGYTYHNYAKTVAEQPRLSLFHAGSRLYQGPQTLLLEGFLDPIDWSQ